ncbi:MAG: chemotaxis protein MotB [Myxococcota bacterium]|jgi:chemotaxis protein MotB
MSARVLALAVAVSLLPGCIGKKKYDDVVSENQELYSRIDGINNAMSALDTELRATKNQLSSTSTSLDATRKQLGSASAENAELMQAVAELEARRARTDAMLASYRDLVGKFQAMIDAGTLTVKVVDGRMVVELATDILFPPGGAYLSREGRQAIADVAKILASISDREYQIAGHTDDQPISTEQFPSNWYLGSSRAIAVSDVLIKEGLPPQRVSVASYAAFRPADTNKTREGRAVNRRIEIIIVPDLSTLPGFDELSRMAAGADEAPAPTERKTR